jgi:toxin ParE1/3/4
LRVEFASPANSEFLAAIEYYESESAGLGVDFVNDVERAVQILGEFPLIGAPAPSGARRMHLGRFPFSLVYKATADTVWIVAVEHHSRLPGFWQDRL